MALSSSASNADRNAKIKIAAAGVCLLIASVLLAHNFGIITLWGGTPKAPPMTAEEQSRVEALLKEKEKKEAELQKLPPAKRPVQVGGS